MDNNKLINCSELLTGKDWHWKVHSCNVLSVLYKTIYDNKRYGLISSCDSKFWCQLFLLCHTGLYQHDSWLVLTRCPSWRFDQKPVDREVKGNTVKWGTKQGSMQPCIGRPDSSPVARAHVYVCASTGGRRTLAPPHTICRIVWGRLKTSHDERVVFIPRFADTLRVCFA